MYGAWWPEKLQTSLVLWQTLGSLSRTSLCEVSSSLPARCWIKNAEHVCQIDPQNKEYSPVALRHTARFFKMGTVIWRSSRLYILSIPKTADGCGQQNHLKSKIWSSGHSIMHSIFWLWCMICLLNSKDSCRSSMLATWSAKLALCVTTDIVFLGSGFRTVAYFMDYPWIHCCHTHLLVSDVLKSFMHAIYSGTCGCSSQDYL